MGRNFHSVCHDCMVKVMHLRGKEGPTLHKFSDNHHKHNYQVIDDYVEEPPEDYYDFFDEYHPNLKGNLRPNPNKREISKTNEEAHKRENDLREILDTHLGIQSEDGLTAAWLVGVSKAVATVQAYVENAESRALMYGQMQALETLYMTGYIGKTTLDFYSNPLMLAKNHRRTVKHWPFNDGVPRLRKHKSVTKRKQQEGENKING